MSYNYDDSALQLAAVRALGCWDLPVNMRGVFLSHPTGAAVLALLCNAGAKQFPDLYASKSRLLKHAIELAADWWAKPHPYGEQYAADTVIYIETPLARFAYHVKSSDPLLAQLLENAPTSDRVWGGQRLQERAREIAVEWLAQRMLELASDPITAGLPF